MGLGGSSVTAANATVGDCYVPNDYAEYSDDIEDCGAIRTKMGLGDTNALGPLQMGCSDDNATRNWPNWQAQARSKHPAGVNACFADGSIHFISNDIEQQVWAYLLCRNDGHVIDPKNFE